MANRIPNLMRVDPRFYEAYLQSKMRGEVVHTTEFQRKVAEMLDAQNKDKRMRFFK